jgi:hypothetical protein
MALAKLSDILKNPRRIPLNPYNTNQTENDPDESAVNHSHGF